MGLRVGLNAAFLEYPRTGSGQYLAQLAKALPALGRGHTYRLLGSRPGLGNRACVPGWLPGKQPRKLYLEQVGLPWACRGERCDVLHYPYFAAPLLSPAPVVVTVHDVIPLLLPEYRGPALVRLYMALAAAATRRARFVVCDSLCSQRDAVRLLGLAPERTRVVYLAAAPELGPADPAAAAAARRRHGLGERFFFYVGGLDARKNLGVLLEAFAPLARRYPEAQLAIAGALSPPSALFPDWQARARRLGLGSSVRFLGGISEEDKNLLYAAAQAFVFPSRYEGFGLPPLEAMACGTPVVCADAASLPEVVGEAALALPPDDVPAWGEALARIWQDEALRAELAARGRARAAAFTWEETARQTAEVYECACS
ncbi:MAG: glycosyltransferase family 4 protein [Chloroflexota bacterium]